MIKRKKQHTNEAEIWNNEGKIMMDELSQLQINRYNKDNEKPNKK